mgnify:CR=1 FL=1
MNYFRSIRWKYFAIFSLITIASILFVKSYWIPNSQKNLRNEYISLINLQLDTLVEAIVPWMIQGQYASIHEILDAHLENNKNWEALILEKDDTRQIYPIESVLILPEENKEIIVHDIVFQGRILGSLTIKVNLDVFFQAESYRYKKLFQILFIFLFLGVLLIALHSELFIIRPVRRLENAVDHIESGEFEKLFIFTQKDEIGRLARRFFEMGQRLHEEQLKANEADRAKNTFLSTMSHEIRTPLNGVIAVAHLLELSDLKPDQQEYVQTILSSSDLLLSIVNDVLDYSKIADGKMELDKTPFCLKDCYETIYPILLRLAQQKDIIFEFNVDFKDDLCVIGDKYRLSQVMLNLVNNAIKFTREGGVYVTFKAIEKNSDLFIHFSVRDTGIGIAEHNIKKLFLQFEQEDISITREYGGTGLGLSICKSILDIMGGEIFVQSVKHQGSTFSFKVRLPLAHKSECMAKSIRSCAPDQEPKKSLNILLAEDNKINQTVARTILEKAGHNVTLANNGEDALKKCMDTPFDLILMDIQMPIMDGLTATQKIRFRDNPNTNTTIIALSADVSSKTVHQAIEVGMNGHISKPFRPNDLLAEIQKVQNTLI